MYITPEDRALYRSKLIKYYYSIQEIKDISIVNRQVNNMSDEVLIENYNRLLDK